MFMKDVASANGLEVLSMYVKALGYGMSRVVETMGVNVVAMTSGVRMLNCLASPTPYCSKILNSHSSHGQKVRNPTDENEQSFAMHHVKGMYPAPHIHEHLATAY